MPARCVDQREFVVPFLDRRYVVKVVLLVVMMPSLVLVPPRAVWVLVECQVPLEAAEAVHWNDHLVP